MAHLNEVQKYYGRASKEVNDALEEFASEKLAERKMVLQTFQLFKDIPNDYVSVIRRLLLFFALVVGLGVGLRHSCSLKKHDFGL